MSEEDIMKEMSVEGAGLWGARYVNVDGGQASDTGGVGTFSISPSPLLFSKLALHFHTFSLLPPSPQALLLSQQPQSTHGALLLSHP